MIQNLDDYREQVKADLLEYAKELWEHDKEITVESIIDSAFVSDQVTGNGSGSYTFNTAEAANNLEKVIWLDETVELFRDMGYEGIPLEKGAETIDVIIRCALVNEFHSDVEDLLHELNEVEPKIEVEPPEAEKLSLADTLKINNAKSKEMYGNTPTSTSQIERDGNDL